jgi:hypothetical protein
MQSKRNFRAALTGLLATGIAACTGNVDSPGPRPGGNLPNTAGGSAGLGGSAGGGGGAEVPVLPLWSGTIGSWCGPGDEATLWLVARPQTAACDASSKKLYSPEMEDASEGLTLKLEMAQLATFPAVLTVGARYCAAAAAGCSDVSVTLTVESYTQGQGAKGSWSFTPPGQAELKGRLEANWCNFDEHLPAHPDGERLARDIKIKEVAVYQGVKVPIVRDMMAVTDRNADLVQQREAMLRVFVEPGAAFQSRALSARFTLQTGIEPLKRFEKTITVSGASQDDDGASTFNIELPKDAFQEGTQYSVELRETSKCTPLMGTPVGARFPEAGLAPVGARLTGPVKVLLVPVRYEADGSNRLPDTSPEQLELMRKRLYSMYPTHEVLLTVREPVGTDRTDLGDMLDQMRQLREDDAPPSDLAYYGLVRQADTFRDYCQQSCVTGIASFGSQSGVSSAGMGIGFLEAAVGTFVHELGHIYRRPHAPCGGAAGADEEYPYPEAALGSWGYDLSTRELLAPGDHVDFMSYCSPEWISDYNYQLLLEQIIVVSERAKMQMARVPGLARKKFRTLLVDTQGHTRWGLDLQPAFEPPGDPIQVEVLDAQGAVIKSVQAFQEQTGEGDRAIFVPNAQPDWHSVRPPGAAATSFAGRTLNKPLTR